MFKLHELSLKNLFKYNASIITSKSFFLQIQDSDAEFIVNLRQGEKGLFLRKGAQNVDDQKKYLRQYEQRFKSGDEIYYKVINRTNNKPEALVRLTEIKQGRKFNWESLISIPNSDPSIPLDIMMTIYSIGFSYLHKEVCGPWDVHKDSKAIQRLHVLTGMAKPISEDQKYLHYQVCIDDFNSQYPKFKKFGFGLIEGISLDLNYAI